MNNIQGAVAAKNVFIRSCLTSKLAGGVFHGWQCLGHRDAALQPVGGHPTSWPLSRIRRFRCGLPPILKNANLVSIPPLDGRIVPFVPKQPGEEHSLHSSPREQLAFWWFHLRGDFKPTIHRGWWCWARRTYLPTYICRKSGLNRTCAVEYLTNR